MAVPSIKTHPKKVAVIGCGIIGLTTAAVALENGHTVAIYSDKPSAQTTSAKAAASFKPHATHWNDLAADIFVRSWHDFERLSQAEDSVKTGVRLHTHWEASSTPMTLAPYHALIPGGVEQHIAPQVPGGHGFGLKYRTFFIDMSQYLPYLEERVKRAGAHITIMPQKFAKMSELEELPADIIFNCTGLGAGELVGDTSVRPIKGQAAITGPIQDLDYSISANGFYVYPRKNDTVLGGTAEWDVDDERVDSGALQLIVRGNKPVVPTLSVEQVTKSYAGLRPYREGGIRIEAVSLGDRKLIHNYGHGGSGVTLSWGSARRAVALI